MNITIVTSIFPPDIGGPATYTSEVLKRLGKRGHHIRVVTPSELAQPSPNVSVLPKGRVRKLKFFGFLYTHFILFLSVLRVSKDSDVIYVQNPTFIGFISLIAGKILRKPVILRFVGDKPWEEAFGRGKTKKPLEEFLSSLEGGVCIKLLFWLQRFVLSKMKKIIVPSQFLKEVLRKYYQVAPEKIKVIYNSVELLDRRDTSSKGLSLRNLRILTVGRLAKHKKVGQIIKVIKRLSEEYPTISLLIVGNGPEKANLQRLSQEMGANNQVKFYGKAGYKETINLLQEADIFILNSVYEGMPHTVIEAMACGTPVIATNIKGTNEVVKDSETGLLVAPDNEEELKEKIIQLLKDGELRKGLAENAYKTVEEKFTWEKNLNLLEKELEEVVT